MTLQQLQYIVTLNEEKNFVSAAEKCFVTQPALTTQIKKLENQLGIIIFDRSKKPLIATEVGLKVIEQAKYVLLQSQKIPDLIKEYQTDLSGNLKIGILPTIGLYLLPLFINPFLSRFPEINVHVSENITETIIKQLHNGSIDVGIIATPVNYKNIITIPIYYEEMYAYISKQHAFIQNERISTQNLVDEDLWLLSSGHCFRNQMIRICKGGQKGLQHSFTYESNSIETLKRIIASKPGITIIPELALLEVAKSEEKQIKKFDDITPIRQISIVVNRAFLKERLIEKLKNEIKSVLPKHMLNSSGRDIVDPF
ncbi:MAG: LysR family transcriptional regulator [Calditrichaeota bacterium]|nr:MAG: LysR family transcriptional regulator [Calditrichota bacterium]MBL1205115.1 LysR family transcriptional regulator [Calditrichota bacterium]NOG44945.1 LysR family transcriptional regulator [Calditrichota bacterium]